jgi:hypothetical protein
VTLKTELTRDAALDRSEHIAEGINGITNISDYDDAKSTCEIHCSSVIEAILRGLLT